MYAQALRGFAVAGHPRRCTFTRANGRYHTSSWICRMRSDDRTIYFEFQPTKTSAQHFRGARKNDAFVTMHWPPISRIATFSRRTDRPIAAFTIFTFASYEVL